MKAHEIAAKTAELIGGDREKTHGPKRVNFENIARLWNAWFRIRPELDACDLSGADVAKLMTLMKIARMESGEFNLDDAIDAAGYACIAGELGSPEEDAEERLPVCPHGVIRGICRVCGEEEG